MLVDSNNSYIGKNSRFYQWSSLILVDEVCYTLIDRIECDLSY